MTNTMKKLYTIKVKDFGCRLNTLNHFLALMLYDDEKDKVFTDTSLRALLLKSMGKNQHIRMCICLKVHALLTILPHTTLLCKVTEYHKITKQLLKLP